MTEPELITGTAENRHRVIFGQTGTGKTYRAFQIVKSAPGYSVFVDANRNIRGGVNKVKDLTFKSRLNVLYLDYTQPAEFSLLVNYLFTLYRRGMYRHRMNLFIDEADIFCHNNPDDIEALLSGGRRFFDITLITTKPAMMGTSHGYVALSQARQIVLLWMRETDYIAIERHTGIFISPEIRAHLEGKYNYVIIDGMEVKLYDGMEKKNAGRKDMPGELPGIQKMPVSEPPNPGPPILPGQTGDNQADTIGT